MPPSARTTVQYRPIEICECTDPATVRAGLAGRALPLIIRGMIDHWPALERWTPDYLAGRCGALDCEYIAEPRKRVVSRLEAFTSRTRVRGSFDEFIRALVDDNGPRVYVLLSNLLRRAPQLTDDFTPLDECIPLCAPHFLRRRLERGPLIWIGPKDMVSPLHLDPEHNVFAQVYGRKEWLVFPPSDQRDLYVPWPEHPDGILNWSPIDVSAPDFDSFPRYGRLRPYRHILEPGEVLYLPAGWWHGVRYEDIAISVNMFWRDAAVPFACRRFFAARFRRRLLRLLGRGASIPRVEAAVVA
ncbi:MAG: cupin-like domain-containing protein [Planctomycetia bacterium]